MIIRKIHVRLVNNEVTHTTSVQKLTMKTSCLQSEDIVQVRGNEVFQVRQRHFDVRHSPGRTINEINRWENLKED